MPKYVYQNLETGEHYEFEQGFHDAAYTHHPENGAPVKRLIFAPAVVFKGSGWYAKDSKSGGTGGAASTKADSSTTEAKGETKSEPKAEAKTEAKKSEPAAAAD